MVRDALAFSFGWRSLATLRVSPWVLYRLLGGNAGVLKMRRHGIYTVARTWHTAVSARAAARDGAVPEAMPMGVSGRRLRTVDTLRYQESDECAECRGSV